MENTIGAGTEQVLQRTATAHVPVPAVALKPGKAPPLAGVPARSTYFCPAGTA